MKKIYSIVTCILLTASVWSQAPQKMSYQAVIRNTNNTLVTSKVIGMRISILKGSSVGTEVYAETQTSTIATNANGLVSIEIGTGTPVIGSFVGIKWSEGPYFIKTETDPTGGTNYTIIGTSELLSIPYALHAKTVENLSGINTGDQDLSGLATSSSVNSSLSTKVDKVNGKGLSTNDYTTVEKSKLAAITGTNTGDQDLSGLATTTTVTSSLALKVDKVTGKDLSTNDYTTIEQTKLAAITGTNTGDQDLSTKVDKVTGKGLSTNDYTTIEQSKLAAITGINTGDQDLSTKVDKVTGKGLSTNDYTTIEQSKLAAISGTNTGDQDLSTKVDKETGKALSTNDYTTVEKNKLAAISGTNTGDQDLTTKVDKVTGKDLLTDGTTPGQMNYWNGSAWVIVSSGDRNQTLTFCDGVPTWGPCYPTGTIHCTNTPTSVVPVTNPTTGKIWMDRNLGATQVATSSSDAASYGDLYQWGRGADGHQCRTSSTTATLSTTDVPGNANFIISNGGNYDWRSTQNDNLWQGVNGVNNPCPSGYRIPTETELNAERASWSANNLSGAFASPLKLPLAGGYDYSDGSLVDVSVGGYYWSSTINGSYSRYLVFDYGSAGVYFNYRAYGFSVRCIKD
jgi:hypothetical protein